MPRQSKNKTFYEKFYKANVLPDGNRRSIEPLEVIIQKLENPPLDDEEQEVVKGSL